MKNIDDFIPKIGQHYLITINSSQSTLDLCNKINSELQAERKVNRLLLIARLFQYDKFLGIDEMHQQKNPYYHGDYFDMLYDMNYLKLEEFEQNMHLNVEQYGKAITAPRS